MKSTHHTLGTDPIRHVHAWLPEDGAVRAVVHIAHGMAEHGARYTRLAEALTARGFAVYANDHRGHGETAASEEDLGFFASSGGWRRVLDDLREHVEHERSLHPDAPMILMGHSMGSLMLQQYLFEHAETIDAGVLSGTQGPPPLIAKAGKLIARLERKRLGERGRSKLLNALSIEDFNKKFRPNRTTADWLSRDEAEVDRYIADPRCGFMVTTSLWVDLLYALPELTAKANVARIPKEIPLYLFAGERDPVGDNGKGVRALVERYRAEGIKDVTLKLYPDARHETLNETNREAVTADLIAWLERVAPAS